MLLRSTDDHVLSVPSTVKENGHKARHRRPPLSATEAALIAVALVNGRLSPKLACKLTGACHAYYSLVAAMDDAKRDALSRGKFTLSGIVNGKAKRNGNGNGNGEHSTESLVEHLRRSSADELMAAGREYGINAIFDAMIVPTFNTDTDKIAVTFKTAK
jgi:hypothetical protein